MSFDWSSYKGNLLWLPRRTIFVCRSGSMAYGTNGPDSDVDVKGVFIAPREYHLGFANRIEQVDSGWDSDCTLFDLKRLFVLTVDCNPNMIELLYTDEADWLFVAGDNCPMGCSHRAPWLEVIGIRDKILNQNAKHRFCGYAMSQIKRIETHRRWLLHPPTHQPTRSEYGLPDYNQIPKEQRETYEAMMQKVIESWQVDLACLDEPTRIDLMNRMTESLADMKLAADDQWVAAGNKIGLDEHAMKYLQAERAYRAALSEWQKYQVWLKERNPARAALEAKFGYDTKHGMHLVRLMRMAREILEGKGVIVRRPDAEELKAIRFHGAWSYDQLVEWAKRQDQELTELMKTSPLRKQPDRVAVDVMCQFLVERFLDRDPNPGK